MDEIREINQHNSSAIIVSHCRILRPETVVHLMILYIKRTLKGKRVNKSVRRL